MRKLSFPLKFKLILLFVFVVGLTISIYLGISLRLFQADKSAYIFSTSLSQSEATSKQLHLVLNHLEQQAWNLPQSESTFKSKELRAWTIYQLGPQGLTVESERPDPDGKIDLATWKIPSIETLVRQKSEIAVNKKISRITFFDKSKNKAVSLYLDRTSFGSDIGQSGAFLNVVLTQKGEVFAGPEFERKYWSEIISQDQKEIVKTYENKYLASSIVSTDYPLIFVSEILQSKAYAVVEEIQHKAFWLAIFVISLGVFFGIIFSKKVTKPLAELATLTEKIGKGDFTQKAVVNSSDEVGVLADSFNLMSSELLRYIDEMKEKIRLEKEVQVAGLVQQCFFPPVEQNNHITIGSFFRPASECGGDWWGVIKNDHQAMFFMADATGHGVPAALLTATAHACKSSLELILETDKTYWTSPAKVLSFFNHAVKQVGSEINMTMSVVIFDFNSMNMFLANASHLPPLFIVGKDCDQLDRSKISPLLTAPGPRLGQELHPIYEEFSQRIEKNDIILLTTDGLTEKMGQRKLIQSIIKSGNLNPDEAVKSLIEDFDLFLNSQNLLQDDDLTLLWLRVQ